MKYRIVKRGFTNGAFYYVVQRKWLFFPWKDEDGYFMDDFFLDIESARKRMDQLQVKKLKDVVVQ